MKKTIFFAKNFCISIIYSNFVADFRQNGKNRTKFINNLIKNIQYYDKS